MHISNSSHEWIVTQWTIEKFVAEKETEFRTVWSRERKRETVNVVEQKMNAKHDNWAV